MKRSFAYQLTFYFIKSSWHKKKDPGRVLFPFELLSPQQLRELAAGGGAESANLRPVVSWPPVDTIGIVARIL